MFLKMRWNVLIFFAVWMNFHVDNLAIYNISNAMLNNPNVRIMLNYVF